MCDTGNCMQNEGMLMLYFFLIQAGPFLYDLLLTWLENVHHFSHLHDNVWFNTIWHTQNMIIFVVFHCGIHKKWLLFTLVLEASRKRCHHHTISDTHGLITLATLSCGYSVSSSTALSFLTNVSETRKLHYLVQSKCKISERQSVY
jgi:hypothetical protein